MPFFPDLNKLTESRN